MPPSPEDLDESLVLVLWCGGLLPGRLLRSCLFGRSGRFLCLRVENERNESEQDDEGQRCE